jgi:hypothetical protein
MHVTEQDLGATILTRERLVIDTAVEKGGADRRARVATRAVAAQSVSAASREDWTTEHRGGFALWHGAGGRSPTR